MASVDVRAELSCCICKELYKDPVTLICGHNFCRTCIGETFQHQDKEEYRCPVCSHHFKKVPQLSSNWSLRNIAETMSSLHPKSRDPGFICTYCIRSVVPAVKSCLLCEAHLCDDHLRVHSKAKEHVMIEPTPTLDTRKLSEHNKMVEYHCTKDDAFSCASCKMDNKHQEHNVERMDEAHTRKKKEQRSVLDNRSRRREETHRRSHVLEDEREALLLKVSGVRERFADLFKDIRRQQEDLEKKVMKEISRQEEQLLLSASDQIQEQQAKKDQPFKRMSDPVTFLQEEALGSHELGDPDVDHIHVLRDLEETVMVMLVNTGMAEIMTHIKTTMKEPKSSDLLLDENTAANDVVISVDLKTVSGSNINQKRPNRPERFKNFQVLTTRKFSSGQHFWCLETNGLGSWIVGLSYPSLERKGCQSCIGYNKKSWGLHKYLDNEYFGIHEGKQVKLPFLFSYPILGIYLDYEGGRISFHELGDPIRHLYTFSAIFSEPLHAAFYVSQDATVKIIN